MVSKRVAFLVLTLVTGLSLFVSGCGGSGGGPNAKDPFVMFINGCSDGPVAFFLNDVNKSGTLAYKAKSAFVSVPFLGQDVGGYDVSLEEPNRSTSYDNFAQVFDKDTSTLVIAVGIKNPPDAERLKRLREVVFKVDRTSPIGNRATLHFLHGFNRISPFGTPSLVLQTFGDQPLFQTDNTAYGKVTTLEVDSGTYKSNADPTKDTHWLAKDPDNDQVYAENLNVTLDPGGIYLVLVSGVESANPNVKQSIQFLKIPPDPSP